MRSVIQRCNWCRVLSEGKVCGEIGKGLVALLGIKRGDTEEDALYISDKILHLRIFEDENNKMNAFGYERSAYDCVTVYLIWRFQTWASAKFY